MAQREWAGHGNVKILTWFSVVHASDLLTFVLSVTLGAESLHPPFCIECISRMFEGRLVAHRNGIWGCNLGSCYLNFFFFN